MCSSGCGGSASRAAPGQHVPERIVLQDTEERVAAEASGRECGTRQATQEACLLAELAQGGRLRLAQLLERLPIQARGDWRQRTRKGFCIEISNRVTYCLTPPANHS